MKKSTKFMSLALTALVMASSLSALAGCNVGGGGNGGGNSSTEKLDSTKTQLYVRNYQGGFGNTWLHNGKAKLEEKYKNISLESGKTGVQVMITDIKETPQIANIQNDEYEVYFVEKVNYLYLEKQGVLEDLTDIVTKSNPYDNKSIISKLSDEQKEFYGIGEGENVKYYALPHYVAPMGIVYDIDLFEEKGWFFVDGYENETVLDDKFVFSDSDKRSAGPDGKYETTYDNGLPATYEDFWTLCERIYQDGYTPLNWGGVNANSFYNTGLMIQLMADNMGKEDYMKSFTMTGELSNVVKLDANGKVVFENGKPATETVTLNGTDNGYEAFRHIAYYYGLDFLKTLMDKIDTYAVSANVDTTSYDAFKAQADYVASRFATNIKRQAMLIEGSWWENEASEYFDKNVKAFGDKAKKENCNYGWLPLPKATAADVGKHNATMVNTIDSLCFVKKGLNSVKKELAFDFVQLMNSDESLVDFTLETNAFKDFNYSFTNDQVKELSPFGQKMYAAWQSYDLINPHHNNDQYYSTIYTTASSRRYAIDTTNIFPAVVFDANKNMTVAEYFEKTYSYTRERIVTWNK